MLGAEIIAKHFVKQGIQRVYLYAGGTIAPLLNAVIQEGIGYFCARHEQGAGYAALAHARLTNTPQVVMVTSGPGATNIVTCVADAYFDSTPLIVITGQVGINDLRGDRNIRQRGFQEVDTVAMMKPVAKAVFLASSVEDLSCLFEEAFALASQGRPGPVVIDLPMNIQRSISSYQTTYHLPIPSSLPLAQDVITRLVTLFQQAKRPTLLVGQGVLLAQATVLLRTLALNHRIPVVTSLLGLSAMNTDDPISMGFLGHTGMPYANLAIHHADLVVALGARLDVRQTGSEVMEFVPQGQIVRVDVDAGELVHSRVRCDLAIHADCKDVLTALLIQLDPVLIPQQYQPWLLTCQKWKQTYALTWQQECHAATGLHPQTIIERVSQLVGSQACVVSTGVGSHQQWVARHFKFDYPVRQWLTSGGHGAMGYDLPSAVGASLACPEKLVICFVGDGSFQINMQELGAIAEHKLNIKIIILDNKRLGIVSQFQLLNWPDDPSTGNKWNPLFDQIAQAGYGIPACSLHDPHELDQKLVPFLQIKGPALMHCHVQEKSDVSPMLLAGQKMNQMWPFKEPVELELEA